MVNSPLNVFSGSTEFIDIVSSIIRSEFRTILTSPGKVGVFPLLIREKGILTDSPTCGAVLTPSEEISRSRTGGIKLV